MRFKHGTRRRALEYEKDWVQALEWVGSADTTLTVASYNERAIRFYQKNGFEIVRDSEHTYAGTMPVVRMIRKGEKS